ncbi:helix-turn-helix transcriptional regulator [Sulfitobacter sp. LCG007]
MNQHPTDPVADTPAYLTTREVADLIRVKERKVYDLAAAGEIPHRRVTGKLLFPAAEIVQWIDGVAASANPRPPVLAGSHDPLLDWAVRESCCGLATLFDGSTSGLDAFAEGRAALCGLHLPDGDDWNIGPVARRGVRDCVLIGWARRRRGLLLPPDLAQQVSGMRDLVGRTVALRQPGSGTAALFARMLAQAGLSEDAVSTVPGWARTEDDAAAAVSAGEADAALGIEAVARPHGLAFLPLITERFDLLVDRRAYFTEPLQALMRFAAGDALLKKADGLCGYDLEGTGRVRWLSP